MSQELSIYVHIPFCKSKCYYCDFCSKENNDDFVVSQYVDAVIQEILNNAEILSEHEIKTIYFGGGTPSYIGDKYIEKILSVIKLFLGDRIVETTIEMNPADCTMEKLTNYVNMGINRFSLGMQSANNDVLKAIGRRHTREDVEKAYNNMSKLGIKNISVDVITGLPKDSINTFKDTLMFVTNLGENIKHISTYSLEVHENTKLDTLLETGFLNLPSEDEEREMNDLTYNILSKAGYNMYEISNYSKPGYESKHNLTYWNQGYYLGFGVSAASYINGKRYSNVCNINEYIEKISNNQSVILETEELDKLDTLKEYIILKLRLTDGINVDEFKNRFKIDIFDIFKKEIEELISNKLLENKNNRIFLSKKGRDLANQVWQKFI